MDTRRASAITVGVLFLVALLLNLWANEIFRTILPVPDYLGQVFLNRDRVVFGNLLNFICAIAMIFIPISLWPVVKEKHKPFVLGYAVFRALEGVLFVYLAIKSLSLISLSEVYTNGNPQALDTLQAVGDSIQYDMEWGGRLDVLIFTLGGMIFYAYLYTSKLVPRLFAVWGGAAIVLLWVGVMLALFSVGVFSERPLMPGMIYFAPPIALNEFVLGIWLIVKGYRVDPGSFAVKRV